MRGHLLLLLEVDIVEDDIVKEIPRTQENIESRLSTFC